LRQYKTNGRLHSHLTDLFAAFENIKPPTKNRLPRFRRLIIFEDSAVAVNGPDSIRLGRKKS
jgi:hypothetical protein